MSQSPGPPDFLWPVMRPGGQRPRSSFGRSMTVLFCWGSVHFWASQSMPEAQRPYSYWRSKSNCNLELMLSLENWNWNCLQDKYKNKMLNIKLTLLYWKKMLYGYSFHLHPKLSSVKFTDEGNAVPLLILTIKSEKNNYKILKESIIYITSIHLHFG